MPDRFLARRATACSIYLAWQEATAKEGGDSCLVCALDEVAWLLNVRGSDVPHCPVLQAYALVHATPKADGREVCDLFVDRAKLPALLAQELADAGIALRPYETIHEAVRIHQ